MVRQLLGVALLGLVVGACSSAPIDPAGEQSSSVDGQEAGSVSIPLTTQVGETAYRLNLATFTITGPALAGKPRTVKPLADTPVHKETLPIGAYSIQLEKGWVLEKKTASDKAFVAVAAQLITPNPTSFVVDGKIVADAFFGFVTTNGDVALGSGDVNIRIGVQDCTAYDSYTAALGELTAQCLGTVDPKAYSVNKDGVLTPNFDSCPLDKSKLTKIRQLLSIQQRTARVPFAKQCIAGRFEVAQKALASTDIAVCPTWKKERVVNPITLETIVRVESLLPELPAADTGQPLRALELLKENSLYTVSGGQGGGKSCQTPAQCGSLCAAAFPGFVIGPSGEQGVLTDPIAWLTDATYKTSAEDPYLRATYYHPMSYYGGVPGVVFGDPNRAEPCGPNTTCLPELCSYYAGSHIKTRMQMDCVIPGDVDTCASYCGPPLPKP
ncbi:MAG: hypothetical protein K0R38_2451 [Polyangiaceae bacterium]|nr:hypothetical protein [Polyangiaceae bacterium]